MSKTQTDDVWISKHTGRKKYHTNPNCRGLKGDERKMLGNLTDEWDLCAYCAGEHENNGGPSEIYLELAYE